MGRKEWTMYLGDPGFLTTFNQNTATFIAVLYIGVQSRIGFRKWICHFEK